MKTEIEYTLDGTEVSEQEIGDAVSQRRAVIRWSHGNWVNVAGLIIYPTRDEAAMESDRDTRNECHSMSDEVWSELATDPVRAIGAAKGLLKQY